MTTDHQIDNTTERHTRDGPAVCVHNAPIYSPDGSEVACLDCDRELCEGFEQGASASSHFVLEALEHRAKALREPITLTLEAFHTVDDIYVKRFVRVEWRGHGHGAGAVVDGTCVKFSYLGTDGWGATQHIDRDQALARIADVRRRRRIHDGLSTSAVPRGPATLIPEPEPNPRKCRGNHGPGQCEDCPS